MLTKYLPFSTNQGWNLGLRCWNTGRRKHAHIRSARTPLPTCWRTFCTWSVSRPDQPAQPGPSNTKRVAHTGPRWRAVCWRWTACWSRPSTYGTSETPFRASEPSPMTGTTERCNPKTPRRTTCVWCRNRKFAAGPEPGPFRKPWLASSPSLSASRLETETGRSQGGAATPMALLGALLVNRTGFLVCPPEIN